MWARRDKRARCIGLYSKHSLGGWGMECRESGESSPWDNFPHVVHIVFPQDCGQPSGDNVAGTASTNGRAPRKTKGREPLTHHRCSE